MVLRVHAGDLVNYPERALRLLSADGFRRLAVYIYRTGHDVAFQRGVADKLFCRLSGEVFARNRAVLAFVGGEEEFVVLGFQHTHVNVRAGAHKRAPRLHKTCGDYAHACVLHKSRRRGHAAHGVAGYTYLVFIHIV